MRILVYYLVKSCKCSVEVTARGYKCVYVFGLFVAKLDCRLMKPIFKIHGKEGKEWSYELCCFYSLSFSLSHWNSPVLRTDVLILGGSACKGGFTVRKSFLLKMLQPLWLIEGLMLFNSPTGCWKGFPLLLGRHYSKEMVMVGFSLVFFCSLWSVAKGSVGVG